MPILIALVAAVAWFVWFNWGRRRARSELGRTLDPLANRLFSRKPCRWGKPGNTKGRFHEYKCKTCGVLAYSSTGKPPVDCKRGVKSGL